jgi:hypothetical protein
MGFKVIKDFLAEEKRIEGMPEESIDEVTKVTDDFEGKNTINVRTYDDDGILYYEALCDDDNDESAERFHDWSQWDSGTVGSKIENKETKEWVWFIC